MSDRIYKSLFGRYKKTLEDGQVIDPEKMAEWMVDAVMMQVGAKSWTVYRSMFLKAIKNEELKLKIRAYFSENRPTKRRSKRILTRSKSLSVEHEKLLIGELLSTRRSMYGRTAAAWIKATIPTGLRPSEWCDTQIIIINELEYLKVKNIKRVSFDDKLLLETREAHGRVSGLHRTIPIHHLEEKTKQIIRAHLAKVSGAVSTGVFESLYESVRKTITASSKRLWPVAVKSPTLYTARHVYRDNLKANLFSEGLPVATVDVITAVLMGHGSKKSNYAYGIDDDEREEGGLGFDPAELQSHIRVMLSVATTIYD